VRITKSADGGLSSILSDSVLDAIKKVFQVSLIPTLGLFIYLMYGLFSGALADVAGKPAESAHALQLVQQLSLYLNISLVVTLLTGILLYYEIDSFGIILLLIAAFLAYGLQFSIDLLFSSDATRLVNNKASQELLKEVHLAALMIGAPGILMILRSLFDRFMTARKGTDLTELTYGKDVAKEEVPRALIGALAKCWQLPFCREGVRKGCPIYHARTKCWKERVGCMCEESIILLSMGGKESTKGQDMTKEAGFVPIGDLLTKSAEEKKANIPTRVGPRGVRIPTNPHITDAQKRQRCHNCVIYNEHQRQKYQVLSPPFTMIVPVLVFFQFDNMLKLMHTLLSSVDKMITHFSINGQGNTDIAKSIAGDVPIETILIVCFTLVLMTWAQRFLEYCTFKLKL
jgi:hypothetical protein